MPDRAGHRPVARRPQWGAGPRGLIVDYVGLGTQIAEALAPRDATKGGRRDIDVAALSEEFKARIASILAPSFDSVDRTDTGFVALQAAITAIGDKDGRDRFAREFTGVEALWEFLAPDPMLDAHKADYMWLARSMRPSSRPGSPTTCCGLAWVPRR